MSTADAAALLGIAHSTLRGWIMRGAIQAERVGRDNFVSRKQIQKFKDDPESWPVRAYTVKRAA
jgi:excisionase family DNA binding protein